MLLHPHNRVSRCETIIAPQNLVALLDRWCPNLANLTGFKRRASQFALINRRVVLSLACRVHIGTYPPLRPD